MRLGNWRGLKFVIALASAFTAIGSAQADILGFGHAFPKTVDAVDYRTGGPYYAPPIPYGHYAKDNDFGTKKLGGLIHGKLAGLSGGLSGHGLGAAGCTDCGNGGGIGHDHGHGLGLGSGLGGHRLSLGLGHGFGHGCGSSCLFSKHKGLDGCGGCATPVASAQSPAPAKVAPIASAQTSPCGSAGCGTKSHHHHGSNAGCGACGGSGLGIGRGFGLGHGLGNACGNCGGRGCGACGGLGGLAGGCGACGGRGCPNCLGGLGSKAHGMLSGLLHHRSNKVQYFVGPGGPVPITPGYVPYVVTTRSPRDFFSFPPFTPER